jgi:hypothetical protein
LAHGVQSGSRTEEVNRSAYIRFPPLGDLRELIDLANMSIPSFFNHTVEGGVGAIPIKICVGKAKVEALRSSQLNVSLPPIAN